MTRISAVARNRIFVRFWSKVLVGDGCWEWQASRNARGYGQFQLATKTTRRAHRVAYWLWHGTEPGEMRVLHRCDNPPCVRPDHLYLGTDSDNMQDRAQRKRFPRPGVFVNRDLTGERNGRAKLTSDQVAEIRRRYAAGEQQRPLAREFGISKGQVWHITSGRHWKHS